MNTEHTAKSASFAEVQALPRAQAQASFPPDNCIEEQGAGEVQCVREQLDDAQLDVDGAVGCPQAGQQRWLPAMSARPVAPPLI